MNKQETVGGLDDFAQEKAVAVHQENELIARRANAYLAELREARSQTEMARAATTAAENALSLYQREYKDRPRWLVPTKNRAADAGTLVAVLSDTHYGEVVRAAEMNGYNAYDMAIAEQRTERFFRRTIKLARDHFAGVKYDGIVLALGGDLVSGDIHDELQQTNALSTYDTVIWAIPRLISGIEMWIKEFGQVHVVTAPGNHGRDGKIPRYKGRSAHNADTHLIKNLALHLTKGDVTFEIPEALDATFSVYDWQFGLEHGDELQKNFSGSAEIGWLGPLIRGTNRKVNAYAGEGKVLHYCIWAHGHQLIPIPSRGAIGNGSLCGYNEFARGKKFKPEPPQQALFIVDPRYGVTLQAPVRVLDRAVEKW